MESPHTSNSSSGNAKMDVLENLSHEATSLIMGFAVKFLAWRYPNSMVTWFGKAGMGMYIACVRACVIFIDNASQDTATAIAIY